MKVASRFRTTQLRIDSPKKRLMRIILIGPPGSGKGTQARLLSQRMNLVHFATGDILRDEAQHDTPQGRRAREFMNDGQLVPDDLVNEIVNARFRGKEKPIRFVMDGYPRTLVQALSFDEVLREQNLELDAAIFLKVEDEEIVRRNSARWTCINPECRATYNTVTKPPSLSGRCDLCQQLLYQRDDDKPETIRNRLQIFHKQHDAIIEHYAKKGLLVEVPGVGDIAAIYDNIVEGLKSHAAPRP